jgi:hypothetical protein
MSAEGVSALNPQKRWGLSGFFRPTHTSTHLSGVFGLEILEILTPSLLNPKSLAIERRSHQTECRYSTLSTNPGSKPRMMLPLATSTRWMRRAAISVSPASAAGILAFSGPGRTMSQGSRCERAIVDERTRAPREINDLGEGGKFLPPDATRLRSAMIVARFFCICPGVRQN